MKKGIFLVLLAVTFHANALFLEDLYTQSLVAFDFSKRPALFTFVQPRCAPCKAQLKSLDCVYEKFKDRVFIFAVQATGDAGELARSLKPLKLAFPLFAKQESFVGRYAGSIGTPRTVLIERGGKVSFTVDGPRDCAFWGSKLEEVLRAAGM
jgi:thiol-disulfide isomerase/thioredoxin